MDQHLEEDAESCLTYDDTDLTDHDGVCSKEFFSFAVVNSVRASSTKVICCHFSSDGKLLATGGHDQKVVLWYTDTLNPKASLEGHSSLITDVRFSPIMSRLATSSFDKTVRVWDYENTENSIRTFAGHTGKVMSLDFHPTKNDLICSCDDGGEMRYWSIGNGNCVRPFKGGSVQMRFQPHHGRYLAVAAGNTVSIFDTETHVCLNSLQGHSKPVQSLCWDRTGKYLATVSKDSVRVWSLGSGTESECVHELSSNGYPPWCSSVFHPEYPSILIVGCYQSLELWNMSESKTMTLPAHGGLVAALAVSPVTGLVASASHDKFVMLWK